MNTSGIRIRSLLARLRRKDRLGILLVISLVMITALVVIGPPRSTSFATPPPPITAIPSITSTVTGQPTLSANLSQTKLIQGAPGDLALEITINTPDSALTSSARQPADVVVVLDRSGSMAAEKRMVYAKSAINDLIGRLNGEDRFGLVTFDTRGEIVTPLSPVTDAFRSAQREVVQGIEPRGSTNMSDGLTIAQGMLRGASPGRVRKVLLLSDGEANIGIIDPAQLGAMARSFSTSEAILSTIGMGLGFNESLMSSLADFGMGHYSFLENLSTLGSIFDKDLQDTRSVYATASGIELELPSGATLVDAGGLAVDRDSSRPQFVRVLSGQLLGGSKKSVIMTLRAPTSSLGHSRLGSIILHYTRDGSAQSVTLDSTALAFDVIETARKEEAVASINKDVYRRNWAENTIGIAQKSISESLRKGDVHGAEMQIQELKAGVARAEAESGIPLRGITVMDFEALDGTVRDVKNSPPAAQDEVRNRKAKELLSQGRDKQVQIAK